MGQGRWNVLVWVWIVAGLVVVIAADVSSRWRGSSPPLWWWILGAVVMAPGLVWFWLRRDGRDYDGRWVGWWRGLPPILRPLGILATVGQFVLFGLLLPAVAVFFLAEGNLAGKLIGVGLLGVSLVFLGLMFRRRT